MEKIKAKRGQKVNSLAEEVIPSTKDEVTVGRWQLQNVCVGRFL